MEKTEFKKAEIKEEMVNQFVAVWNEAYKLGYAKGKCDGIKYSIAKMEEVLPPKNLKY